MAKTNSFNIHDKVFSVLENSLGRRLTARQIAMKIVEMFPAECEAKIARASVDFSNYTFEDQLVAEIGSRWRRVLEKYPTVQTVEKRPREFYISNSTEEKEAEEGIPQAVEAPSVRLSEHDLYPILGEYLWSEFKCYTLRVDERKSTNTRGPKGNMWLYPDIVGMQILSNEWSKDTSALARAAKAELAHLYSFEVKLTINRSNVREVFFQTLSNSAWANHSYLVAPDINSKAMRELGLLCSSHGIGLIQLDVTDPSNSQTLIPTNMRSSIDWNLLNRLAVENRDARQFVKAVRDFYLTNETNIRNWDLVPK